MIIIRIRAIATVFLLAITMSSARGQAIAFEKLDVTLKDYGYVEVSAKWQERTAEPNCFIEPFGLCVSQSNAISAAVVAAIASLLTAIIKAVFDHTTSSRRHSFESSEREKREEFEVAERRKREAFENVQADAQRQFQEEQARSAAEIQTRLQKELQSYIQLEKWREESWQRNLERLELASQQLSKTSSRLISLIEEGPHYDDLRMIQETAEVLDIFGDFQTSVGHFALPKPIADLSRQLVAHVTKVLLTLSPSQEVRQRRDRQEQLNPLQRELQGMTIAFMKHCTEFEHNPAAYFGDKGAA